MSFFYMMDDLRYLFSLFFSFFFLFLRGVVVVGLARDGCLVRSWVGVTQWGWRCRRPASEAGALWVFASNETRNHHAIARLGGFLSLN